MQASFQHKVFILATCNDDELLDATRFVFNSIRIGFPTAQIFAHLNDLSVGNNSTVAMDASDACAHITFLQKKVTHHEWIAHLVNLQQTPFFICDTDMVFWQDFEEFDFSGNALAGHFMPEFYDDLTQAFDQPRLHTSLLYIDPVLVRNKLDEFITKRFGPDFKKIPIRFQEANHYTSFIAPFFAPEVSKLRYYDTCASLWALVGGQRFDEAMLDCYDHLHCGTYSKHVEGRIEAARNIRRTHAAVFKDPEIARGCWRSQDAYFNSKSN